VRGGGLLAFQERQEVDAVEFVVRREPGGGRSGGHIEIDHRLVEDLSCGQRAGHAATNGVRRPPSVSMPFPMSGRFSEPSHAPAFNGAPLSPIKTMSVFFFLAHFFYF